MNIANLLRRSAQIFGDQPAIYSGEKCLWNYRKFARRSASIATFLRNTIGIPLGGRVAIFMTNSPEYLEIIYGIWWAGLIAVPINCKLHGLEVDFIIGESEADLLFISSDLAVDCLDNVSGSNCLRKVVVAGSPEYLGIFELEGWEIEHRRSEDIAWLFYTSGTTGRPKGVMQSNRNLLAMTSCYFSDVDSVSQSDAHVYAAPMSHGAGLYNFPFVMKGARHVIPESGGFDVVELCRLSKSIGNLSLFAAPTMVKRLVEHIEGKSGDANGFKTIVYGGGPMYVEDIQHALNVMGNRFVQIYGQGECPMTITALPREIVANKMDPKWRQRLASVGFAQSLVEVRIADPEGKSVPVGESGEVLVRGDVVMAGYWNNPQATDNSIRDEWLWTGDIGAIDEDGFLTLRDRSKDVIISGGSNIYPREVEEVLLTHPLVSEVSVVGMPDPDWGEVVVAFVVSGSVTPEALDELCLSRIARFKRPKHYRFVGSLPKNNYGKVMKTELRKLLV